jgi:hypothetical protein
MTRDAAVALIWGCFVFDNHSFPGLISRCTSMKVRFGRISLRTDDSWDIEQKPRNIPNCGMICIPLMKGGKYTMDKELLDTTSVATMQLVMGGSYDHRLELH